MGVPGKSPPHRPTQAQHQAGVMNLAVHRQQFAAHGRDFRTLGVIEQLLQPTLGNRRRRRIQPQ
ncbi:hypothetical protein D3C81_787120 [compost metagenome]